MTDTPQPDKPAERCQTCGSTNPDARATYHGMDCNNMFHSWWHDSAPQAPAPQVEEWMRAAADEIVYFVAEYYKTGGLIGHPAHNGAAPVRFIITKHCPKGERK